MFDSSIQERVENYFSSMNPMAHRILVDTDTVKRKNEKWEQIPYEQQCRLIMDAFVKDKVGEKYSFYPQNKPDIESFPKLCIRSGEKYVIDEENQGKGSGNTWRDEHSGPFTWETQSQLNFSLVEKSRKEPPLPRQPPPVDKLNNAKFYKVLPTKKSMQKENSVKFKTFVAVDDDRHFLENNMCTPNHLQTFSAKNIATTVSDVKPKAEKESSVDLKPVMCTERKICNKPLPIPVLPPSIDESDSNVENAKHNEDTASAPEIVDMQESEKKLCASLNDFSLNIDLSPSSDSDIPKTGFDFLDDW